MVVVLLSIIASPTIVLQVADAGELTPAQSDQIIEQLAESIERAAHAAVQIPKTFRPCDTAKSCGWISAERPFVVTVTLLDGLENVSITARRVGLTAPPRADEVIAVPGGEAIRGKLMRMADKLFGGIELPRTSIIDHSNTTPVVTNEASPITTYSLLGLSVAAAGLATGFAISSHTAAKDLTSASVPDPAFDDLERRAILHRDLSITLVGCAVVTAGAAMVLSAWK